MNNKRIAKKIAQEYLNRLSYDFSSVQCNIPEEIANDIFQWGKDNIPDSDLLEDGREDDIHVTVKYGIHMIDPTKVRDYLMTQKPIEATLGPITLFEADDHDVVKLDIESPQLRKLNKVISDNFQVTDTHPEYIPHITIGYVKKGLGKKYDGRKDFDGKKVVLNSVLFSGKDNRRTLLKFPKQEA